MPGPGSTPKEVIELLREGADTAAPKPKRYDGYNQTACTCDPTESFNRSCTVHGELPAPAAEARPSEYRSQGSESPTRPAERSSTTAPADGGEAPEQMGEERCDFVMYPAPDMPGWSPIVCRRNRAQHDEAEMLRDISHPFTPGQRAGKP